MRETTVNIEDETMTKTHSEDSVFQFYIAQYKDEVERLRHELAALLSFNADEYAEKLTREVENGVRAQDILSRIKMLKRELRLCQYRTCQDMFFSEFEDFYPEPKLIEARLPQKEPPAYSEVPLPDWLVRNLNNAPVAPLQTEDQKQRLKLIAESSVLTLAGRVLSVPSFDQQNGYNYHEIFRTTDSTHLSTLSRYGSLKRTPSLSDLAINQ